MRFSSLFTIFASWLLTFSPVHGSRFPATKAIGTVIQTQGFVYKKREDEEKYTLTSPNIPFTAKDRLKTSNKSTAILRVEGGFHLKLTPSTEFTIKKAPNSGGSILMLSLFKGGLYIKTIPSTSDEERGFQLSAGRITINGSSGSIFISRQNEAEVPEIFLHSKDVEGNIAHPYSKNVTFSDGDTYHTTSKGTRELTKPLHKKWVNDLIWKFEGEIEPKFYNYEFPQIGKGNN